MKPQEILDLTFYSSDLAEELTIRDYLKQLLEELWREEEGFSGKRPFGNSGWQHDVYCALVKAGAIEGTVHTYDDGDEDIDYDQSKACKVMLKIIQAL